MAGVQRGRRGNAGAWEREFPLSLPLKNLPSVFWSEMLIEFSLSVTLIWSYQEKSSFDKLLAKVNFPRTFHGTTCLPKIVADVFDWKKKKKNSKYDPSENVRGYLFPHYESFRPHFSYKHPTAPFHNMQGAGLAQWWERSPSNNVSRVRFPD